MAEAGARYRHFKTGKEYIVVAIGKHSETLEEMVVYEAQYDEPDMLSKVWIRPRDMFEEMVEWPSGSGEMVARFEKLA